MSILNLHKILLNLFRGSRVTFAEQPQFPVTSAGNDSDSSQNAQDFAAYHMKSSRYLLLRLKIVLMLLRKHKLSAKKLLNLVVCYLSYYLRRDTSATFPFAISFELSNECNANCVFCRSKSGQIYNQNPNDDTFVAKGFMPYELYSQVIDEAKEYLLMAILYVNGEPLIYKQLYAAIQHATDNNVASMIATNGILLNAENIQKLIKSDVDFIKVAISGFSASSYSKQVRFGDIDKIKNNLERLHAENSANGNKTIVMIDFIQYNYNQHEILPAKEFCNRLGFMFNVRQGNTAHSDDTPETVNNRVEPTETLCDWPWKVLTINWNGDVFPCCDYVVWTNLNPYRQIAPGAVNIRDIWNGAAAVRNRKIHRTQGRKAIPVCSRCSRNSINFKY